MGTNYFLRSEGMHPDPTFGYCVPEVTRLLEIIDTAASAARERVERPWEAAREALRWLEHEIAPIAELARAKAMQREEPCHPTPRIHDGEPRFDTGGLHIGMSSFGWAFSLRLYPGVLEEHEDYSSSWYVPDDGTLYRVGQVLKKSNITCLDDWRKLFEAFGCVDEYGRAVTADAMLNVITKRGRGERSGGDDGLRLDETGLRRHEPRDGYGPVPGTDYDHCVGDFS